MSAEYIKLRIKEGLKIRDPKTGSMLECGKVYRMICTQFWLRRLKDGDCEMVTEKSSEPKKKSSKKAQKKTEKKAEPEKEKSEPAEKLDQIEEN